MNAFDLVLGATLVLVALLALGARDLFRAIVMFIVFGLSMALVWVRLEAPDIALAEAAIGAGITGVLLLDTLGYLRRRFERGVEPEAIDGETPLVAHTPRVTTSPDDGGANRVHPRHSSSGETRP